VTRHHPLPNCPPAIYTKAEPKAGRLLTYWICLCLHQSTTEHLNRSHKNQMVELECKTVLQSSVYF